MTLDLIMDNYDVLNTLYLGFYSNVYKCFDRENKKYVAIKNIKTKLSDPEDIKNELFILEKVKSHPNMVELIARSKNLFVFLFYPDTLTSMMEKRIIPPDMRKLFVRQILEGVSFLHSQKIIHLDLKPCNIMIDEKQNIKIGDFGISFSFENDYYDPFFLDEGEETHQIQTLQYRAPEILLGTKRYTNTVDIWSVGCIFGGMVINKSLFPGDSEIGQLREIFKVLGTPNNEVWEGVEDYPLYNRISKIFSPPYERDLGRKFPEITEEITIIEKLLEYNPEKRTSAEELLKDVFLIL